MTSREQGQRLQLAREHAGYKSGRMAALRLGWKYPTYAAHESGLRTFPPKVASKYARAFNVHPDFLTYGTRPPEWWDNQGTELKEATAPVRYMALFNGQPANEIERMADMDVTRRDYCIADVGDLPAGVYAFRVGNDELRDVAPRGTILVIDKNPSIGPGAIVILSVKRQVQPSIRKVKLLPGGRVRYVSSSEDYEDLEENDAKIIGRAILAIRSI